MPDRGQGGPARLLQMRLDDHLRSDKRSWLVRGVAAFGMDRWARLAGVALAPLLLATSDLGSLGADWLFPALIVYVLLTALMPRHRLLLGADLVVAAVIVLLTGIDVAPYLPFVLVAVAGPAAREGLWAGLAAGGVIGSMLLIALAFADEPAALGIAGVVATILLPPLAGVTAAAAGEVMEDRSMRDRRILQEANRLLSSLQAIADEVPGGLDVSSVAANLMHEVRQLDGVTAAFLLCENASGYEQVGRTGRVLDLHGHIMLEELVPLTTAAPTTVRPDQLPTALTDTCSDVPRWLVLPMGSGARPAAALFVGFDDPAVADRIRPVLEPLAEDTRLALDNARLFDGTRSRAVDAARRQLASDLHDGVAQSLAHLRMELELLAIRDPSTGAEAERLAQVAESALLDLRRTISGLRIAREDALSARLERHLREVRTPHGPRIDLISLDDLPLDATTIEEVFRVAQEALSNALRHAEASEITIMLDRDLEYLVLRVEDDGIGLDPTMIETSTGVGLTSMRDRARRLQAQLRVEPADRGGTRVTLRVPSRPSAQRTATSTEG